MTDTVAGVYSRSDVWDRWIRRCATIGALVLVYPLLLGALPILIPLALLSDITSPGRFRFSRFLLFLVFGLSCELVGLVAAFCLWLLRVLRIDSERRYVARHYALQWWWGDLIARGARAIFGVKISVEAEAELGVRPMLLLVRHSSPLDTLLAVHLISRPHGIRLRYVLKRELLWDPCLDIVGHRVPNYFVDRRATDTDAELRGVRALADGVGSGEGVLIYPEGTRFSEGKRRYLLNKFAQRGDEHLVDRVERYHAVLPPRIGGTLALLDAMPGAQVVVCAHRGFEAARSWRALLRGELIGAEIDVRLSEVEAPAADAPREAKSEWLLSVWDDVDRYVTDRGSSA